MQKKYLVILAILLASCEGPMMPYSKQIATPIGPGVIPTSIPMYKENVINPAFLKDSQGTNVIPWYGAYTNWGTVDDATGVNLFVYQHFAPINGKWNVPVNTPQQTSDSIASGSPPVSSFWSNSLPDILG